MRFHSLRHVALAALCLVGLAAARSADAASASAPIRIVAAESTYGVIAQAIGGDRVAVDSLVRNPNVDPHQFEATPQTARRVAGARIVLLNGLGYDQWMVKLLAANPAAGRQVVEAATLDPGLISADRNPHVFYDPRVALRVATRLADLLKVDDPTHAAVYAANLRRFVADLARVDAAVAQLRRQHPGLRVTATEPVFGYMVRQLGWSNEGEAFQINMMNDTEPSPAEVVRFESALRQRRVALLIYNHQVTDPLAQRMRAIAAESGVPTVGVDEFVPPNTGYVQWLLQTLQAVGRALDGVAR